MQEGLQMQESYYGPWPIQKTRVELGKEYLVCIGSEYGPPRQLVSIFSSQWMMYSWLPEKQVKNVTQPSPPCAERAAPVQAGAEQPLQWSRPKQDSVLTPPREMEKKN